MRYPSSSIVWFLAIASLPGYLRADELLPADRPISEVIDYYVDARLVRNNILPAPLAEDTTLIRRLTLDLAGRIPTATESQEFASSDSPQKWTLAVDRLLNSPDFAFHLRNELDTLLLADNPTNNEWRAYLLEATRNNRPWNEMFREMMLGSNAELAKGKTDPALTFLTVRAKDLDDLTNDTSSIFFGVNVSCAKCHDHPLVDDWKQDHYYGMASFFNRTYLTKSNFLAEKYSGDVKFKTTAGEEKKAALMFLSGSVIEEPAIEKTKEQQKEEEEEVKRQMKDDKAAPPKPPEFSPRAQFVELALREGDNRFLARAIINRTWARLTGYGLVHPLDQLHSANPPSHPELLDWLERDFLTNGYDLKRLIRGIVLSNTYGRTSKWDHDGQRPPGSEFFAVAAIRPMSPRQYALSLQLASSNPATIPSSSDPAVWDKYREQQENAANGLASRFEVPGEHFQVGVEEALYFSNNQEVENNFLRDSGDRLIGHLKSIEDRRAMITEACWAIFSRSPAEEEVAALEGYLATQQDDALSTVRQVVWALMTSPELRFVY